LFPTFAGFVNVRPFVKKQDRFKFKLRQSIAVYTETRITLTADLPCPVKYLSNGFAFRQNFRLPTFRRVFSAGHRAANQPFVFGARPVPLAIPILTSFFAGANLLPTVFFAFIFDYNGVTDSFGNL
jgi:hypothetical protein